MTTGGRRDYPFGRRLSTKRVRKVFCFHKRRRTLGYTLFLFLLFASLSLSFLSEQRVEAFHVVDLGGSSKPSFQVIISKVAKSGRLKKAAALESFQLNAIPLQSRGDAFSEESVASDVDVSASTEINSTEVPTTSEPPGSPTSQLLLNFNASGSIGSLLMQMQKKEAELRELNQSASLLLSEEQALNLDPPFASSSSSTNGIIADGEPSYNNSTTSSTKNGLFSWIRKSEDDATNSMASSDTNIWDPTAMDDDLARELDNSISIRITNSIKDITLLEPPDLFLRPMEGDESTTTGAADPGYILPLSRPEHYDGRIGRDMRHLAVSIASCIDTVEEWQIVCQQTTGGLGPLIESIREGASSIRETSGASPSSLEREENFQVAVTACKALRDLSALSLDLASVITDGLLRANAGYMSSSDFSLMDDLCTMLKHGDDLSDYLRTDAAGNRDKRRRRLRWLRRKEERLRRKQNDAKNEDNDVLSSSTKAQPRSNSPKWPIGMFRKRRESRLRCKLYVTQLLLAMTCASDCAVDAIRSTDGLTGVLLDYSSYAKKEQRRRWIRYPGEMIKSKWISAKKRKTKRNEDKQPMEQETPESGEERRRQPFIEAASLKNNLNGRIQGTANQVLAAIGYNEWVPKIPGQKGLRILCLDGGGSRGMTSVVAMKCLVDSLGGMEVADCFDLVVGTSTGAIIAFLVGLNRETSEQAVERYDVLIEKIFTKSAFSTPMLLFTTASYDESPFMTVLTEILKDKTMLDSRANPAVPLVFAVTSKMSSNPTHVALFRNYNYNGGELPDPFIINPEDARENLGLPLEDEAKCIRMSDYPKKKETIQPAPGTITPDNGSRHPGSFRVLQKYALRASTAAPTVFKPVLMGGEMYCDGGIVASNPSAIAIHEARTIFPDVPIELVVSIGTGGFKEQKSEPRIGWDGIIGQIINSATDGEQIHHILEDVLGDGTTAQGKTSVSNTSYMRFNPVLGMPDEFPIDVTDPEKLQQIKTITKAYMEEPEQQEKLQALSGILKGRSRKRLRRWFGRR